MTSLRNQILSRYVGFYRSLLNSPSREVRALVRIVSSDPRSTTCRNLVLLRNKTRMSQPELFSSNRIKAELPVKTVPEKGMWRLGLITSLLKVRAEKNDRVEDTKATTAMIDSLCST